MMQSSTTSSTGPSAYGRSSAIGIEILLPDPDGFVEGEDYVELNGVRIDKPFVEKPVSGEDHNIYIYYPHSMVSLRRASAALGCYPRCQLKDPGKHSTLYKNRLQDRAG